MLLPHGWPSAIQFLIIRSLATRAFSRSPKASLFITWEARRRKRPEVSHIRSHQFVPCRRTQDNHERSSSSGYQLATLIPSWLVDSSLPRRNEIAKVIWRIQQFYIAYSIIKQNRTLVNYNTTRCDALQPLREATTIPISVSGKAIYRRSKSGSGEHDTTPTPLHQWGV